jgi:mono/diheme cytochrome c family protein
MNLPLAPKDPPSMKTSTTTHLLSCTKIRPVSRLGLGSKILIMGGAALVAGSLQPVAAHADSVQVARGKYLVRLAGCTDCHTPGHFLGKPDMSRFLAGSDVGFEVPGVGTVVGRNLTPDKETGIGGWTLEQITTAIRTGVRPDGRALSPIMPWAAYAGMRQADVEAIAVFLKTLPPVKRHIPGPFKANEKTTTFRWRIIPPDGLAAAAP